MVVLGMNSVFIDHGAAIVDKTLFVRRAADRELPELVFVKTVKGVRLLRLA